MTSPRFYAGILKPLLASPLAWAGTCYAVGLIIVNLDLGGHGLFAPGLLRAEYVMAGALWAFLVAVTGLAIAVVLLVWSRAIRGHWGGLVTAAGESVMVVGALYWVLSALSGYRIALDPRVPDAPFWGPLGVLALNSLVVLSLLISFWGASRYLRRWVAEPVQGLAAVAALTVILAFSVSLYAHYVYPLFPPALGGGLRQRVVLILKTEHTGSLRGVGIDSSPTGSVGPVELLYESPDGFFIAFPETGTAASAVFVPREIVDVVRYGRDLSNYVGGRYAEHHQSSPTKATATSNPGGDATATPMAAPQTVQASQPPRL